MKKYYFMLACSALWAIAGTFAAGAYFGCGEYDKAIFCLFCAWVNVGCGCAWLFRIVNKK